MGVFSTRQRGTQRELGRAPMHSQGFACHVSFHYKTISLTPVPMSGPAILNSPSYLLTQYVTLTPQCHYAIPMPLRSGLLCRSPGNYAALAAGASPIYVPALPRDIFWNIVRTSCSKLGHTQFDIRSFIAGRSPC